MYSHINQYIVINSVLKTQFIMRTLRSVHAPPTNSDLFSCGILSFSGGPDSGWYNDCLGAGRSGDQIPVEERFSAPVQNGPGAQPPFYTVGTLSFSRG